MLGLKLFAIVGLAGFIAGHGAWEIGKTYSPPTIRQYLNSSCCTADGNPRSSLVSASTTGPFWPLILHQQFSTGALA